MSPNPLHSTIAFQDIHSVRTQLEQTADINQLSAIQVIRKFARLFSEQITFTGITLLHAAIIRFKYCRQNHGVQLEKECLEVMDSLVKRNAWLDIPDDKGKTPLHLAAEYEFEEAVLYLLLKGAEPSFEIVDEYSQQTELKQLEIKSLQQHGAAGRYSIGGHLPKIKIPIQTEIVSHNSNISTLINTAKQAPPEFSEQNYSNSSKKLYNLKRRAILALKLYIAWVTIHNPNGRRFSYHGPQGISRAKGSLRTVLSTKNIKAVYSSLTHLLQQSGNHDHSIWYFLKTAGIPKQYTFERSQHRFYKNYYEKQAMLEALRKETYPPRQK